MTIRVGLLALIVCSACNREPPEPTEAEWIQLRKSFAQDLQDNLRNEGGGLGVAVTTADDDARKLVVRVPGCSRRALEDMVAAPKVQKNLWEYRFWRIECEGHPQENATIEPPLRRR